MLLACSRGGESSSRKPVVEGVRRLLGGHAQDFLRLVDHLAHFADAPGALRLAAVRAEDFGGLGGAGFDSRADLTLADAIAVADVHGWGRP